MLGFTNTDNAFYITVTPIYFSTTFLPYRNVEMPNFTTCPINGFYNSYYLLHTIQFNIYLRDKIIAILHHFRLHVYKIHL